MNSHCQLINNLFLSFYLIFLNVDNTLQSVDNTILQSFYLIFMYFEIKLYFLVLVYISKIKTPYNQVSRGEYFYII